MAWTLPPGRVGSECATLREALFVINDEDQEVRPLNMKRKLREALT